MTQRYAWLLMAAFMLFPAGLLGAGQDQKPKQKKGWLGVSIQNVTERIQKREKLPTDEGAYVADVVDDSPADSAGLKRGDVIVSFGGKAIYEPDDLSRFVSRTAPGSKSEVAYYRDGARKTLSVVVGHESTRERSSYAFTMPPMPHIEVFMGGVTLGATVKTLNKQLADYFGAPNGEGVLVEDVEEGRAGAKAGLQAGDVIVRIGKRSVDNVDDITKELRKSEAGDKLELEVWRKGGRKTLTLEVEERPENAPDPLEHRRIFRMQPRARSFEWETEDDGEVEGAVKLKREFETLIDGEPQTAPVFKTRKSMSVTI